MVLVVTDEELLLLVMVVGGLVVGFRSRGRQQLNSSTLRPIICCSRLGSRRALARLASVPVPVLCVGSPPRVVLLPCKHLVLCEACSKMMEGKGAECPMCRAPVEQHMMIFPA